jgi:hypothetical protein
MTEHKTHVASLAQPKNSQLKCAADRLDRLAE